MIINNLLIQEQTKGKANGHKSNVGLLWRRSWFAIGIGVWCWFVELEAGVELFMSLFCCEKGSGYGRSG